ncbi:MAG: helix-turn-helix domain-containing protein [Blastomonas sp.]
MSKRTSNQERSSRMRQNLLSVARDHFAERGYDAASTSEIVAAANVTRGALYHHFADKRALFDAVVVQEAHAVASEIAKRADSNTAPLAALLDGSAAFLDAMSLEGRVRLLLIDGPAALGPGRMWEIDAEAGGQELAEGLRAAAPHIPELLAGVMAKLMSAAFDRAALAISLGEDRGVHAEALERMIACLVAKEQMAMQS